ncbi:MAG: type II toxin-antitoxin system YafQ family toxin [Bacteroidaceae bacterium]|nr:type II toxin-antitoxin system YafQ family toxin [Bacteroidaceae bacterium]
MKTIKRSTQFRKDFKRYANNPQKVSSLLEIVRLLENELPIPAHYKPHWLHGEFEGCMECHVGNDFLLIWIDETSDVIKLLRLGTHHELFGL